MNNARLNKTRDYECGLVFQTLRNKARLRQQDIATLVGVGVNTVQYWESGTTYPKVETLKKLLAIYLRFEVFSAGQELAEVEELWEKVRQEAPRFNALFDQEWFDELLTSVSRHRQHKSDQLDRLPRVPNNLPARLTSFVGRKKEQEMLSGWLRPVSTPSSVRLVTLSGEGGCGKTSLALEVARAMLGNYQQGVWLVELAPLSSDSEVVQALAATLGLKEQSGSPLLATITDYLREKLILLVLDNCEHLIKECARVVDSLLRECPQLVVLATSRELLKVAGETVFRVPTLTLPPSINSSNSNEMGRDLAYELMEYEAVQLFVERGRSANPQFALTEHNRAAVAQLCRRLDGIPLAIELAAARLRVLTIFELNERLADRFRLLRSGSNRAVLPRQQTLRATVDWSYELLSQSEQLLFRRLSVFAGGWTLEAAEEVCALDGLARDEILDLLHELVNKSLVIVEEVEDESLVSEVPQSNLSRLRFRLLETLREYGQEHLEQVELKPGEISFDFSNEKYQLQTQHLLYYTAVAIQAIPDDYTLQSYDQGRGIKLLELEHPNLREALNWSTNSKNQAIDSSLLVSAMRLACAAARLWRRRGYLQEGQEYMSRLQARALQSGLHSTSQYAWVCYWLGEFIQDRGDYKQAQAIHEETLALFKVLGNNLGIILELLALSDTLKRQGYNKEAYQLCQQSLALSKELGYTLYVGHSLIQLGNLCTTLGNYTEAASCLETALKIARESGDPKEIAVCLVNLGILATVQGDYEAANTSLQESLPLLREIGDRSRLSSCLGNLGFLAMSLGDKAKASYYFKQALAIQKEIGSRRLIALTLSNLAQVALALHNYEEADRNIGEAIVIQKQIGDRLGVGLSLLLKASLEQEEGDYEAALASQRKGLAIFWEVSEKHQLLSALHAMAATAGDYFKALNKEGAEDTKAYQQLARSVRLAGIVTNLMTTMKGKLMPEQLEILDQICLNGRQQMGENTFEQIFAEGQALTLEEAVDYALTDTLNSESN